MSEQIFSEKDIPFEELNRFGLSRQMIEDLPQKTQEALLRGERSPVLPLRFRIGKRVFKAYSRFRLVQIPHYQKSNLPEAKGNHNKVAPVLSVLFFPRLKDVQNDLFTDQQRSDLYSGGIVKAALPEESNTSMEDPVEYYCQMVLKNRQLFTVPAEHLEHNIKTLVERFNLNKVECQALVSGKPITVYAGGDQLTFGIDLRDPNGIRMCNGNSTQWKYEFDNSLYNHPMPEKEYHFATNGCWIESTDGTFEYVDEDDYDQSILQELQKKRDLNIREASSMGSFSRGR